jgi:hypothetical protein
MASKKMYVAVAAAIKVQVDESRRREREGGMGSAAISELQVLGALTADIAYIFKQDNPRFSFERFVDACGL